MRLAFIWPQRVHDKEITLEALAEVYSEVADMVVVQNFGRRDTPRTSADYENADPLSHYKTELERGAAKDL